VIEGLTVAAIKSMGKLTSVCCDLDWPEHRHESLGGDGKSTHPNRLREPSKEEVELYLECRCEDY